MDYEPVTFSKKSVAVPDGEQERTATDIFSEWERSIVESLVLPPEAFREPERCSISFIYPYEFRF
jgi:hypothetical protein